MIFRQFSGDAQDKFELMHQKFSVLAAEQFLHFRTVWVRKELTLLEQSRHNDTEHFVLHIGTLSGSTARVMSFNMAVVMQHFRLSMQKPYAVKHQSMGISKEL